MSRHVCGLGLAMVMFIAVPATLVANYWIVRETRHWHFALVLLIVVLQAAIIPAAIVFSFLGG